MDDENKDYLEYLCLYTDDHIKIKKFIVDHNININDADLLKIVCSRNKENIFDLFINELNADLSIDNYSIIKYYAMIGDIDKLEYLFMKCDINKDSFIKSCKKSTLNNSKKTFNYFYR